VLFSPPIDPHMTHSPRRSWFPSLLLGAALPLVAQEPAPQPAKPSPVLVTMSFPGGTLAEYVAKIRAAEPRANIIVAADAATAQLPALELRGTGLEQALEAVSAIAEAPFSVRVKEFRGAGEPVYSIVAVGAGNTPAEVKPQKDEETTQVFSLNRLTDDARTESYAGSGFAAAAILSAIETAASHGQRNLWLRFHEDSGLLIARGNRSTLAIVKDVLSNLERDVSHRRQQPAPKGAPAKDAPPEPSTK
jgi:hypothetical protein